MELLKQKILEQGIVISDNILKVDSFLNHQLDPDLIVAIGQEIARRFHNDGVTKILTIEASGIAVALAAAIEMKVPVVFAKKNKPSTLQGQVYSAGVYSFTKKEQVTISVAANYLDPTDRILIIDDFLAMGAAANGLVEIVQQSNATLVGLGIVIEKGFQKGGQELRTKGLRVETLVTIASLTDGQVLFG